MIKLKENLKPCKSAAKKRGEGRSALIQAARIAFEEVGFDGTHSNDIARRAGYSPQTFYRHFENKIDIFLAVYEQWAESEAKAIDIADGVKGLADSLVQHHTAYRVFRRSLRALTVTDPQVGEARACIRILQVEALTERHSRFGRLSFAHRLSALLQLERHCDAIGDGEWTALGVDTATSQDMLQEMLRTYFY